MRFEVITVATERRVGLERLRRSMGRFGATITAIGDGEHFHGFGWRFKRLMQAVRRSEAELVCHLDAYDTICLEPLESALEKYQTSRQPILMSFEPSPQPEYWLSLNPGMMIARREALLDVFSDSILEALFPDHFNDMFQIQTLWGNEKSLFAVDGEERLFFTQSALNPVALVRQNGKMLNPRTGLAPSFVHAPNGASLQNVEAWLYDN